jgi:hypothetical protein
MLSAPTGPAGEKLESLVVAIELKQAWRWSSAFLPGIEGIFYNLRMRENSSKRRDRFYAEMTMFWA